MKLSITILGLLIFTLLSCNSTKQAAEDDLPVAFNDKVMITMKPKVNAADLELEYQEYSLKSKGLASKSANKVMFNFDDTKITNSQMLALLNKNKNIIKAERLTNNKRTTTTGISYKKGSSSPTK